MFFTVRRVVVLLDADRDTLLRLTHSINEFDVTDDMSEMLSSICVSMLVVELNRMKHSVHKVLLNMKRLSD